MSKWSEDLPKDLQNKIEIVDEKISSKLEDITEIVLNNQRRVLELFRKHHVAEEDLVGSTGYGYDDIGRDKLDAMFADYFKTEDAMVRPQLTSGTHAISTAFFGVLRPHDTLHYLTGMPYDTIQEVIGVAGDNPGTLEEHLINFSYTPLQIGRASCRERV